MRTFQIRSRGQVALFAGIWLLAFVPFFQFGALQQTGYGSAAKSAEALANYAPLVAWASQHLGLVIAFPIIEIIPLVVLIRLPEILQSIIYADQRGRIGQWCGVAGLALLALITLINMVQLVAAAQQFAGASAIGQTSIGASFRVASITESLIADIGGSVLLTIWLVSVNVPLFRIGGFERVSGGIGVLSAALFAATAGLVAFNPQQPQGAIAGTALALFGVWLIVTGLLLIRRAPALGQPISEEENAPQGA